MNFWKTYFFQTYSYNEVIQLAFGVGASEDWCPDVIAFLSASLNPNYRKRYSAAQLAATPLAAFGRSSIQGRRELAKLAASCNDRKALGNSQTNLNALFDYRREPRPAPGHCRVS